MQPRELDKNEAEHIAQMELENYNKYVSGDIYAFRLYKTFKPVKKNGRIYETERELIESCGDIYSFCDIAPNLSAEDAELFEEDLKSLKNYS